MGTTRVPSLDGHCPASTLLWTPPTPAPARHRFRFRLMRSGSRVAPAARAGLPSCPRVLSRRAVPTTPPQPPGFQACYKAKRGVAAFARCTRTRPPDRVFRGSYGFTGVTARRFAAVAPLKGPTVEPGVLERGGRPPPPRRALHAEQAIGVEGSFHPSRSRAPWLGIRASPGSGKNELSGAGLLDRPAEAG